MSAVPRPLARIIALVALVVFAGPAWAQADGDAGVDAEAPVAADAGAADVAPPASPTPELDARISARLDAAFGAVQALSAVSTAVTGGVVTLRGRVPSAAARDTARSIAERIEGVLYVQDLVELEALEPGRADVDGQARTGVDERIAGQLRTVFESAPELSQITVRVVRGVVRLAGEAPSEKAVESATAVAGKLDGVVHVSEAVTITVVDVGDRVGPVMTKLREQGRRAVEMLPILGLALALFLAFYFIARLLRGWSRPYELITSNGLARGILRQAVFAGVLVVGLLLALEIAGATAMVGAVLGTAGVLGLALGFALQDIVQNYISGVMLSLRQPFGPRDFVRIGEHEGIIIRLTTRETLLMTLDGNHLRIPNAKVFGEVIVNFARNPQRRFDFAVGVGTEDDLVAAQALGLEVLAAMPGVLDAPPPRAVIEELGDSTVNLRFYGWVDQTDADFVKTKSVAIRRTKEAFDEAGVAMPSPTYRLEMVGEPAAAEPEAPAAPEARPAPDRAALAMADDISVDRTIEDKVDAERAEDDEDLLSGPTSGSD